MEVEGVTAESSVTAAGLRAKAGGGAGWRAGGDASLTTMPCCVQLWRKLVNRGGRKPTARAFFTVQDYCRWRRLSFKAKTYWGNFDKIAGCPSNRLNNCAIW